MDKTATLLIGIVGAMLMLTQVAISAETVNDPSFGLPRDVAAQAKERCTKLTTSLASQALCMRWEAQGYAQMNPAGQHSGAVAYDLDAEAAKANARASYRDPAAVAVCPPPHRMTEKDGCR